MPLDQIWLMFLFAHKLEISLSTPINVSLVDNDEFQDKSVNILLICLEGHIMNETIFVIILNDCDGKWNVREIT